MTATPQPPQDPSQPGPSGYPTYPGAGEPPPGPGGYPTHPGTPPGGGSGGYPGGPTSDVPQPPSVRTAVRLMLLGGALSLVSVIISVATLGSLKDDIREELVKDDPSVSQSTVDAAYGISIGFAVVFGAIGVLLWLWMAWKNGQGRSWARIVATVLGGLNAVFTLLSFLTANAEPISMVFSGINLVLAVVILVLLWRKDASAFFAARSRPELI